MTHPNYHQPCTTASKYVEGRIEQGWLCLQPRFLQDRYLDFPPPEMLLWLNERAGPKVEQYDLRIRDDNGDWDVVNREVLIKDRQIALMFKKSWCH